VLCQFTDVNHSVFTRQNLNKCTERHDSNNTTGVLVANFNILSKGCDSGFGLVSVLTIRRSDNDCTVVLNVDSHTEFVDHSTNNRSTRTDDCTDLVGRNLERKHSRCVLAEVVSTCSDCCFHIVENLQSSNSSLLKSLLHNLEGNSLNLNVHLKCGYTITCTRNLEVHVTRVVFSTLNVGQNSVVVDVLLVSDQSHRYTSNRG
jgi:hypothetical protein